MTIEELRIKYQSIPDEIKNINRWIGYSIETDDNGEPKKVPRNALNGGYARTNDKLTWTSFELAIRGVAKFGLVGLGFILGKDYNTGETYVGIDLDNHPDKITGQKAMTEEQFSDFASEFITALDSYSEYSHSGEGVHIICKGNLPEGARKKAGCPVEMYDSGRFFTMTGKVINAQAIMPRTEELVPLWQKYLFSEKAKVSTVEANRVNYETKIENGALIIAEVDEASEQTKLDDIELINKIKSSKNGFDFITLYNGDMSKYSNDHSSADLALCNILAFWTGCDIDQMDRIFRSSALMRDKWDRNLGKTTYGNYVLQKAIDATREVYQGKQEVQVIETREMPVQQTIDGFPIENIDLNGNVILKVKFDFTKPYELNDTGNAERMYDYFGDLFKYNTTHNNFMFWNGRTWTLDNKGYVRKYADEVYKAIKEEIKHDNEYIQQESTKIQKAFELPVSEEQKRDLLERNAKIEEYGDIVEAKIKNAGKIANKAGKDNMINELKHLHDMPIDNSQFDNDPYLLNTLSGVVDLRTGQILPFDKNRYLAKNTGCEVSFEEPTVWIKFLHEILKRDNPAETEELVDCIQKAVGYTLSGCTNEQCMFLMYGATGSNGKSTFIEQISRIMGEYGGSTPVQTLMGKKGNQTTEMLFSLSALYGKRVVTTGETEEGEKLSEQTVKLLTGADTITARPLYGQQFDYKPMYKIWMATNNKPTIRGQEYAIWRRLYFFPFEQTFTEETKDRELPAKLAKETPQILGWAIKGFMRYLKEGLKKPKCIEEALAEYKDEMNIINTYLKEQCQDFPNYYTKANTLYEDYCKWCKLSNERTMSNQKFGKELIQKGYVKVRRNDGYYYVGIKLNDDKKGMAFSDDD